MNSKELVVKIFGEFFVKYEHLYHKLTQYKMDFSY